MVHAFLPSTIDAIDRRLSIKYLLLMAVRMAIHFIYDFGHMHMWNPWHAVGYLVLVAVYYPILYAAIGYINVKYWYNRSYLVHNRTFHKEHDRWAFPEQAYMFVGIVAVIDVVTNVTWVALDIAFPANVPLMGWLGVGFFILWFVLAWFLVRPVIHRAGLGERELRGGTKDMELARVDYENRVLVR